MFKARVEAILEAKQQTKDWLDEEGKTHVTSLVESDLLTATERIQNLATSKLEKIQRARRSANMYLKEMEGHFEKFEQTADDIHKEPATRKPHVPKSNLFEGITNNDLERNDTVSEPTNDETQVSPTNDISYYNRIVESLSGSNDLNDQVVISRSIFNIALLLGLAGDHE